MNFKPELAQAVLEGRKTVTRRLCRPNPRSPWYRDRCSLVEGRSYAVCPGRAQHQLGRVIVQRVDRQRLGHLSTDEAHLEGFDTAELFEAAFVAINGAYNPLLEVWRIQFACEIPGTRRCGRCSDDGWIEIFDDAENPVGAENCPKLDKPWHRPFNYSGLLPA